MADSQMVLQVGVFIGFIALSLTMGASDIVDIDGIDDFENFDPDLEPFNMSDYQTQENLELVNYTDDRGVMYESLRWNGESTQGQAVYDVREIDSMRFQVGTSYFFPGLAAFNHDTDDELGLLRGGSGDRVRLTGTLDLEDVDTLRIEFSDEEAYLVSLVFPEDELGLTDRMRLFLNIFTLDADVNWFTYLVGIPLGMVGLYLFIKIVKDLIPFT